MAIFVRAITVILLVLVTEQATDGLGCKNALIQLESTFWMKGRESIIADDAPSVVECPAGYYAAECVCENEVNCDGTLFSPGNPRLCTAYMQYKAQGGAVALVKCSLSRGLETKALHTDEVHDASDPLNCPDGYSMVSCTKRDRWSQGRRTTFLREQSPLQNFACTWRRENDKGPNSTDISAMCIKMKSCCC